MYCQKCGKELDNEKFCPNCGKQIEVDKQEKIQNTAKKIDDVGKGMQGCGCILMLLPILGVLIFFIYVLITS